MLIFIKNLKRLVLFVFLASLLEIVLNFIFIEYIVKNKFGNNWNYYQNNDNFSSLFYQNIFIYSISGILLVSLLSIKKINKLINEIKVIVLFFLIIIVMLFILLTTFGFDSSNLFLVILGIIVKAIPAYLIKYFK